MKKNIYCLVLWLLSGAVTKIQAIDVSFFYTNSESGIVDFINSNPTSDYTNYRIDGSYTGSLFTLVELAASRNYTNMLSALENYGAITTYEVATNEFSPLAYAVSASATQTIEYLVDLRPDWLEIETPLIGTLIFEVLRSNTVELAEILIDAGANINATNYIGSTPLDMAAYEDVSLFELIRSRGGLFNEGMIKGPTISPTIRSGLIQKYASQTCEAYSNYFAFPSGQTLYYPVAENLLHGIMYTGELSSAQSDLLNTEMLNVASNCYGTVIVRYHKDSDHGLFGYIYPVLEANQIYGIMIKGDDEDQPLFNENVFPMLNP